MILVSLYLFVTFVYLNIELNSIITDLMFNTRIFFELKNVYIFCLITESVVMWIGATVLLIV